uniref:Uncharacterized protein n=1 Tax=Arion vulgaris TaxID=1028688 RepID=A0A0B7ACC7_9EUPU
MFNFYKLQQANFMEKKKRYKSTNFSLRMMANRDYLLENLTGNRSHLFLSDCFTLNTNKIPDKSNKL